MKPMETTIMLFLGTVILLPTYGCEPSQEPKTAKAAPSLIQGDGNPGNPVVIPHAESINVDADPADWRLVPAMPAPFAKTRTSPLKLAWNDNGLYGLLQVKDKKVEADELSPWAADCLELWLDKDNSKEDSLVDTTQQYAFCPAEDGENGKGAFLLPDGSGGEMDEEGAIEVSWKKTSDGYVLEFSLDAKELAPAKLQSGTKIGLNFAVNDDGKTVVQFFSDKTADDGFANPGSWGTAVLKK
jgi:hypothetical protein